MKSWLEKNDKETYSMHNEGKSIATERIIRTLKNKIYKYMTSISKNVYIDKLDDIFNEYNNTYHDTTKMKPVDVKSNTYVDFNNEIDNKDLKINTVPRTYVIDDLNGEEIFGTFYENELQKTN